jgi:hypothetical protein
MTRNYQDLSTRGNGYASIGVSQENRGEFEMK